MHGEDAVNVRGHRSSCAYEIGSVNYTHGHAHTYIFACNGGLVTCHRQQQSGACQPMYTEETELDCCSS